MSGTLQVYILETLTGSNNKKGMIALKTVILAGGFGSRISEESHLKPKPMIEIGGKPILWHIMKHYSTHGFHEFVICCGYRQHVIKEYFADYFLHNSDVTFDLRSGNAVNVVHSGAEPWRVAVVDTGIETMTGGRVRRIRPYVGNEAFMLTYGDGVADVDVASLVEFHKSHGKIATLSVVKPEGRFGILDMEGASIKSFREKSEDDVSYINGGFMVFKPEIFGYLDDDATVLERAPLERLAADGQLMAYRHDGFWQCMDTQRDREKLQNLWKAGNAPWKTW